VRLRKHIVVYVARAGQEEGSVQAEVVHQMLSLAVLRVDGRVVLGSLSFRSILELEELLLAIELDDELARIIPVCNRHVEVEHDEVKQILRERVVGAHVLDFPDGLDTLLHLGKRLEPVLRRRHYEAASLEDGRKHEQLQLIIVGNQDMLPVLLLVLRLVV